MRSLHSLNSLTRSLSGESNSRLGALAAAASSTTTKQSRYSPPRRFCSASAAAPARGVDRNVSLPRERHDHASDGSNDIRASSSDDNLSGLSGYYGLMSLSNDGLSSERSSMSSVTNPTLMTQQPQDGHTSTRPRIATSKTNTNTTTAGSLRRLASLESFNSVPSFYHHEDAPRGVSRAGRLRVILGTSSRSNNSNNSSSCCNHSMRSSTSSTRSNNNNNNNLIEIQPGVSLPLRGAEETEQAIAAGFYVQCECLAGCGSNHADDDTRHLHCILDCDYFLCPDCRSITANPLKETDTGGDGSGAGEGGLGLGFRLQPQDRLAAC